MVKRFVIRAYGDSLSLPRVSEGVPFYETYTEKLAALWRSCLPKAEIYLFNRSFSGATAPELSETFRSDSFYFGMPGGDVLILQCGIVDCAPRPVPHWLRNLIEHSPAQIKNRAIMFLHNNRARLLKNGFSWRETSPDLFAQNVRKILGAAVEQFHRIYVLNIAPTTAETERRSPGLSRSIDQYNEILRLETKPWDKQGAVLIDVFDAISRVEGGLGRFISQDGHHITLEGHRLYLRLIVERELMFGLSANSFDGVKMIVRPKNER